MTTILIVSSEEGREKCQGVYSSLDDRTMADIQMYNAHSLYRLKGGRIWLPDPLDASK